MNLDELRAAMNRVRRVNAGEDATKIYRTQKAWSPGTDAYQAMLADKALIVDALLDPTPIDRDVLRDVGFLERGSEFVNGGMMVETNRPESTPDIWGWFVMIHSVVWQGIPHELRPRTRGQLLSLLAALGETDNGK